LLFENGLKDKISADNGVVKIAHYGSSPIFALCTAHPRELAHVCQSQGLLVRPIMPPTVPARTQRVRVCVHAGNTVEEIQRLLDTLSRWVSSRQEEKSML
jgi:8-amino-7-oxononanoate synthase